VWVVGLVLAGVPLLPATDHWRFYQQSGICLPLPVTRQTFPGMDYAFVVNIFNVFLVKIKSKNIKTFPCGMSSILSPESHGTGAPAICCESPCCETKAEQKQLPALASKRPLSLCQIRFLRCVQL
jgi:hypothetical protein